MKLTEIIIHNFRSIHEQTFSLLDYSLLVGENNTGKSAVIDALRCFYEKDGYKYKKDRDTCWISPDDDDSWIDLTFKLQDEEWQSLPDYCKLPDSCFRVRKFFQTKSKDANNNNKAGAIYAYKTDGTLNEEPFHGAKDVQRGKFGKLVYIPAVSTVDEYTKLSGPSALRDLLSDVLEDVISTSPVFSQFAKDFEKFSKEIKNDKSDSDRSISGLEEELNQSISNWGTQFEIKIEQPNAGTIIKNLITQEFSDKYHDKAQSIGQYGSGFQRQFIFSIIDVASRYVTKKQAKEKEFSPDSSLILFEEPEAFLHPPQQERLSASLRKLSLGTDTQIICSTHSPHFVDKNTDELKGLCRLSKVDGITSMHQIDDEIWELIVNKNQVLNDIAQKYSKLKSTLEQEDLLPEMEAVKYFLWLDPERSRLFFSKHILLVEGPTEKYLVTRLLTDEKLETKEGDITVIDTLGKYNTHRFMSLLSAFAIPHSVIVDDDNNKNEHAELNQLIKDTASDYTHSIDFVSGNLESFLGVEDANQSNHRKPQHLMMLYEKNSIPENNLTNFCELVNQSLKQVKS